MQTDSDTARQAAVDAYKAGLADYTKNSPSLRDLAAQLGVPRSTIHNRMKSGAQDHKTAAAHLQAMTPAEETSLVDYIRRMSLIGHPPSHEDIRDIANYLRRSRLSTTPVEITPTSSLSASVPLLGKNWISKFRLRHPDIVSTWTRALDTARIDGEAPEKLVAWFAELRGLYDRHHYEAGNIYNMDETGFAIGATQSTRVLTVIGNGRRGTKATKADLRGEWTTSIECVSADGNALPPLVILKGKAGFNKAWLPVMHSELADRWTWATSNTGWSSDYMGLKWLRNVFIPSTTPTLTARPAAQRPRRLLIVDGHGSHVRSTFIGLCIENDIDLMILPAHTSHKTQPLDVGVFRALKGAMTRETDRIVTYQKGMIHKAVYTSLLIAARSQAMTPDNIKSGFKKTGIWPLRPSVVIGDIEPPATPAAALSEAARTPLGSLMTENRDFIRDHADSLRTPAKRHFTSLSDRLEAAYAKIALLEREIAARAELERLKRPRKGMTVANVGQHHFSTPQVLQQAIQLESEGAAHRSRQAASQPSRMAQDGPERSPTPTPITMRL